ncbi:MAG: hypothetical protein KAW95_04260, partial [Dehalococcoidia bacterium]|nr:hypothetical protein [Dehalococcoidia bacterium]
PTWCYPSLTRNGCGPGSPDIIVEVGNRVGSDIDCVAVSRRGNAVFRCHNSIKLGGTGYCLEGELPSVS